MAPDILSTIPFLRDVGTAALRDIAKSAQWYCVPSGCPLYLDREPADRIWFVISGSLAVFRTSNDGTQDFVGHIRQGEPVGEFALIAGEAHSGNVYALRDTEVLALERSIFNRLIRRHPELMANLARTVLFRSRQNRRKNPRSQPRVFALINASSSLDMTARAQSLKTSLAAIGKTAIIVDSQSKDQNGKWFDQIEQDHDYVLLVADITQNAWATQCQRRADRTWVFGRIASEPNHQFLSHIGAAAQTFQLIDLVLVKSGNQPPDYSVQHWIRATQAQRVFYWHDDNATDLARLARVIAGTSIGLVLGGGGARAYAHIGAVRALREAHCPFDFVGGTSMGAVIAACVAMGWNDNEIERRIWNAFVESSPLDDFVLPVVALTRGRKVDRRLAENFGETQIEDLTVPFFCISTNLTQRTTKTHQWGLLRDALRASIALPGIMPPVVLGQDVHVDGAVLDNFPIGAMCDQHRGFNIGIDVAQQHSLNPRDFEHPKSFLSWVLSNGFKSPPPIAELLMRSATANATQGFKGASADFLIVPELAGIELRDWKAFDRAVEAGYVATTRALQSAPASIGLFQAPKLTK
jgi:NTE family protein